MPSEYDYVKCCVCGENKFIDPSSLLGPGDSWMVSGLDFSWAFVVYSEIPGFPGYFIGTNGTVWSARVNGYPDKRGKLKRIKGELLGGYIRVSFSTPSGNKKIFIHDLVLMTFVCDRPDGKIARHFPDKTKTNNNLWNLHWGTHKENYEDRKIHGTTLYGSNNSNSKIIESDVIDIINRSKNGETLRSISESYPLSESVISRIVSGESWKHVGESREVRNKMVRKFVDPEEMIRLRNTGMTLREISSEVGIHHSNVSRFFAKLRKKNESV